jgi:hypothetical protein
MFNNFKNPSEDVKQLIRDTASTDMAVLSNAQNQLAKALTIPLRDAILDGDNLSPIFRPTMVKPTADVKFPLSLVNPGEEDEYVAFVKAREGRVPEKRVEGDYVMIPTYKVANAIDWNLDFARDEQYNVIALALKVMLQGFTKKMNDDGWQTVISAATDRNILVNDGDATAGQFTKRLVSMLATAMKRNGGGNNSSVNQFSLTDLFFSPEGMEDIRNWGLDQVDDVTRRQLFVGPQGNVMSIFGVRLHEMTEFGEGTEYQNFFTNVLGASLAAGDVELCIGLDLSKDISFYMPMKENVSVFPDPNMHRRMLEGYYAWAEHGFAALDSRVVMLGSF